MKNLFRILIIINLFSCEVDDRPSIVKFKSGEYDSREGKFIAKFPGEPSVLRQHFDMGMLGEFDQYSFQYNIANEHIYSVSYIDFSPEFLKSWDNEQLFDQTIKSLSDQLGNFRIVSKGVDSSKIYQKNITYTLSSSVLGEFMKSKFVRYSDRIYQILFVCRRRQPGNQKIDEFINSFKIYNANTTSATI
ncbi:MAG: hypothetical protein AAGC64_14140 [Bacteroidota bacterium]